MQFPLKDYIIYLYYSLIILFNYIIHIIHVNRYIALNRDGNKALLQGLKNCKSWNKHIIDFTFERHLSCFPITCSTKTKTIFFNKVHSWSAFVLKWEYIEQYYSYRLAFKKWLLWLLSSNSLYSVHPRHCLDRKTENMRQRNIRKKWGYWHLFEKETDLHFKF